MNWFLTFVFLSISVSLIKATDLDEAWKTYKLTHKKEYRSADDEARKRLFAATHDMIEKHNSNSGVFKLEHNVFSDMTQREKNKFLGTDLSFLNSTVQERKFSHFLTVDDRQLPASIDYRTDPCLAPVKDQGNCGSGWAFPAITSLEFSKCKKTCNIKILLSEQQLVDCDTVDNGCVGGFYTNAWNYLTNGSAIQATYPYTATKGTCKYTPSMLGARVASWGWVASKNATAMQNALNTYGPLAVAISALNSFYNYKSGVYFDCDCTAVTVNHGVVVVGYGIDANMVPYWIVRNSWGPNWGAAGYILMKRGVNMCNIETYPAYVVAA